MTTIKFFLFGKFHIEADAKVIEKIESRKAEELLCYLLLHRDQPHSREHLAEVFWEEIAPEQSKSYLRKALWQLQSIMEQYGGQGLLLVEAEWIQIDPQFDFWLDIDVFEKAFRDSEGLTGKDLAEQQSKRIRSAVELYRGNLMQGWYQDWCLYERERLQFLYLAMLDKLMDHCEAHKTYEKGLIFGEKILQNDRARERTYRRLMRLHYLAGDRTAALRQYQRCKIALKEELDVEPADRTRLLYEKIRADKLETPVQLNRVRNKEGNEMEEPLRMLFSHLNILHQSLSQIQTQLAEDLKVIQRTMKSNRD